MEMNAERWTATQHYVRDLFGGGDPLTSGLMSRAVAAGLPDIAISADTGRLLMMLASMTGVGRGAGLALELGTLAGFSAIWIARGLAPDGRLITLEKNPRHADFAQREFVRAGVADRVEIRRTAALDALPRLDAEFGPGAFDFIFADAIKTEYAAYWEWSRAHLRPGGLFTAHNALGSRSWWVDASSTPEAEVERQAVDRFVRAVAGDPAFDATVLPTHQGLLVARRRAS
jgi:caffeoyl-CoA O-methyltransferase